MLLINEEQTINSILNGDCLKNEKEVLDILIDNLVDKMKRVNIKLDVYKNIMDFIDRHPNLFAKNQTELVENTKKFLAYKKESKDGTEITLGFRRGKGYEWIMALHNDTMTDEEILAYIGKVDGLQSNTAECKKAIV